MPELRRCSRTLALRRNWWAYLAIALGLYTLATTLGNDAGRSAADPVIAAETPLAVMTSVPTARCASADGAADQSAPLPVSPEVTALAPGLLPLGEQPKFSWAEIPDEPGGPKRWRLLESGVPYSVSLARARRCLRGRHLVYVGDSVMRASYMNLVHWLHTGSWYSGPTHFEDVRLWVHSEIYFTNTTFALNSPDGAQIEICDCFRGYYRGHVENRYYRDLRHEVSVSLVQNREHITYGHDPWLLTPDGCHLPAHQTGDKCCGTRQQYCASGYCNDTVTWKQKFGERGASINITLGLFGGPGSIDSLVFNTGLWGCLDKAYGASYTAAAERLVAAGKSLMEGGVRNVIWRATTAHNSATAWDGRCESEINVLLPLLRAGGWRTHDTFNATLLMTKPGGGGGGWYDGAHFGQAAHRGLNEMLLTDILDGCP